jgi:hypothetical protein
MANCLQKQHVAGPVIKKALFFGDLSLFPWEIRLKERRTALREACKEDCKTGSNATAREYERPWTQVGSSKEGLEFEGCGAAVMQNFHDNGESESKITLDLQAVSIPFGEDEMSKDLSVLLALAFVAFSFRPAQAEGTMKATFRSAAFGGLLGALVGAGVWMVSENDEWHDHISYIPTGAGVGILVGTAYGLYTNTVVQQRAATEVKDGRLTFNVPTSGCQRLHIHQQKRIG